MKTKELYKTLQLALNKFDESMDFPIDEPHKESTIQRFEYTFELSWKLMNSILKDQNIESYGVKNIIREAYKLGLIKDTNIWFKYALARNQASHLYNEEIAEDVYKVAKNNFSKTVKDLLIKSDQYLES